MLLVSTSCGLFRRWNGVKRPRVLEIYLSRSGGLSCASGWTRFPKLPSKSALCEARYRLGSEAMRNLFTSVARLLSNVSPLGSSLSGLRVMAVDGTCLNLADTISSDECFGGPPQKRVERSIFSQARLVTLAGVGTHVIVDAVVGARKMSEVEPTRELANCLQPGG